MKTRHRHTMKEQIAELLAGAESEDEAILRIALMLEINRDVHQLSADDRRSYEEIIPPDLVWLSLDPKEEEELVQGLAAVFVAKNRNPSILWALGKATPGVGLRALLEVLEVVGNGLGNEERWQALVALE